MTHMIHMVIDVTRLLMAKFVSPEGRSIQTHKNWCIELDSVTYSFEVACPKIYEISNIKLVKLILDTNVVL